MRTRGRFGSMAISAGRDRGRRNISRGVNPRNTRRNFAATKCLQHRLRARTVPVPISGRHHKKGVPRAGPSLFSSPFASGEKRAERRRAERRVSLRALDSAAGIQPRLAAADETANLSPCPSRFFRRGSGIIYGGFGLTPALRKGMNRADSIPVSFMLTLGSFAIAVFTVLGCVSWACLNDRDQT
jgi:hypothetical protein